MDCNPKKILKDFAIAMNNIRKTVPDEYSAFIKEKEVILKQGKIGEKTKWLLLLVASLSQKCPVCVARAVEHCLRAGWSKEEIIEASMVAVLIGGSSVMTFVAMVEKAISELE